MAKTKPTAIVKQAPAAMARPLEDWEQEMAAQAKEEVAKESAGMPRISHMGGALKIDGKPVAGNKLRLGVIDFVFSKAYYEGEFDASTPQTPTCYAFGLEEPGMVPHPNAPDKQAETCAACPHNAFGTAERGRGKRCKDERRLGVVVEVDDPTSIQAAEVRMLSVPPGSLKNWGKYLRNSVPEITPTGNVRAILTEVSTEPSGGAYALTFKPVDRLTKEMVAVIRTRQENVRQQLMAPYPNIEAEEKPAPKKKLKGQ